MKKLILAAAALMVSLAAYGQGQFVFNNRIPPDVTAQFKLSDGTIPQGTDYTVQLFGGPSGSAQTGWSQLATTDFRTGAAAGYVNGITVTVPGATTSADLFIRLFKGVGTAGSAIGTINDAGGKEMVFTTPVGVAPNPPPNMPLGTSPLTFTTSVPEPTTLALGVLGLGSLLFIRRRK
jgi:hypothetical protein